MPFFPRRVPVRRDLLRMLIAAVVVLVAVLAGSALGGPGTDALRVVRAVSTPASATGHPVMPVAGATLIRTQALRGEHGATRSASSSPTRFDAHRAAVTATARPTGTSSPTASKLWPAVLPARRGPPAPAFVVVLRTTVPDAVASVPASPGTARAPPTSA